MLFKDISFLQLWWPFCSLERDHFMIWAILVEGITCIRNFSVKLFFNLGFRRCPLKYFLSTALTALLFALEQPFGQFC